MKAIVRYLDETTPIDCPYGNVKRVITGGEYDKANVHVVSVTEGGEHYHEAYDELYYVLSGSGRIWLDRKAHALKPGAVVTIPAGTVHSLAADEDEQLNFIIIGLPGMSADDPRFLPRKPPNR